MTNETNEQDPQPTAQEAGGAAAGESNVDGGVAASAPTASLMSTASVAPTAESDSSITDPKPTATDAPAVAEPGEDVAPAADASSTADSASAMPASTGDISSPSGASSLADAVDARTFEERVEDRFLQLEGFLMRLPRSIHHAMSQGSADVEEFAGRVVAHLFSKE